MNNLLTFDQFLNLVDKVYYENEFKLRYGQTIMNVLYQVWPEKYKEISGGDYDCFYDDGTARSTLDYLEKEWDDKNI
jgi:hypothetical protein